MNEHWVDRSITVMLRQSKVGGVTVSRTGRCRFCCHRDATLPWLLRELAEAIQFRSQPHLEDGIAPAANGRGAGLDEFSVKLVSSEVWLSLVNAQRHLCYELPIAMPAMNTKTPPTTT